MICIGYEKLNELLKRNEIPAYRLAQELDIPTSTFSAWKHGEYRPKVDKLKKIADYFGVPVTYFIE